MISQYDVWSFLWITPSTWRVAQIGLANWLTDWLIWHPSAQYGYIDASVKQAYWLRWLRMADDNTMRMLLVGASAHNIGGVHGILTFTISNKTADMKNIL